VTNLKNGRSARILLVEDEVLIARALGFNLEQEGYEVCSTGSGREALSLFAERPFDLIILDIMLEDLDGFEVVRRIRQSDPKVPVIMLTARAAPEDRVRGLELRADDYVVKPFHLREMLLRVRRMLERAEWYAGEGASQGPTAVGPWPVDFEGLQGEGPRGTFQLTVLEARLLRTLIAAPNRVFSRRELLEEVWDYHSGVETRTVDNFIVRLRKHFEEEPEQPRHFISLRGRGYMYVP
jgi:two-component system alkaline phosphatase synthesis response regulator PhoP